MISITMTLKPGKVTNVTPFSTRMSGTKLISANYRGVSCGSTLLYLRLASLPIASMDTTAAIDQCLLFRLTITASASCSSASGSKSISNSTLFDPQAFNTSFEYLCRPLQPLALPDNPSKVGTFSCLFFSTPFCVKTSSHFNAEEVTMNLSSQWTVCVLHMSSPRSRTS